MQVSEEQRAEQRGSQTAPPFAMPMQRRGALSLAWPAALTLLLQGVALWVYAVAAGFSQITGYIAIGRRFGGPLGLSRLALAYWGYDGQFYYFIARFPFQLPRGSFDSPAERYSRILYPALARAFSLGNADALPWVLLLLNLLAIVGAVLLVGWVLRERGLPSWLALVPGLYCGMTLGLLRDLTDPLAVCWLALALVGLQRRRWLLTAGALALALLTRETALIFAACFFAPLVVERRWWRLAGSLALVFAPYLAWQAVLSLWLGRWGLGETLFNRSNNLAPVPFSGLVAAPDTRTLIQFILFACIPAVAAALGGALTLIIKRPWHDALQLGAALAALAYGAAFTLQPAAHWLDIWAPMRLAAPLAVLLPVLLPPRWFLGIWRAVLALMLFSFTIALAPIPARPF